jgi:pilus assembly protein CpaB
MAGLVAFATLSRAAEAPTRQQSETPLVSVVVAARPVTVRTALTGEDLALREVPADSVPAGAVRDLEAAIGRLSMVELYPDETLLSQRLVDPNVIAADGRTALVLVEEQVLMAVPAQDLLSRVGVLKPGDHVDVLFSLDFPSNRGVAATGDDDDEEQATFALLENVTIAALVGDPTVVEESVDRTSGAVIVPQAVLVTISPQDALAVKYMIDAGGVIDLVLRAPGVDRLFDTKPVDVDYLINRYNIPTEPGR